MIVVVGGSRRKAGKTTVMCEIIAATREAEWTAIKLSPHAHEPSATGDTGRYLAAGAARAVLDRTLPTKLEGNLIIESNSILATLVPDLFIFVQSEGEQKPSAQEHADRADVVLLRGHATPELIARVKQGVQH